MGIEYWILNVQNLYHILIKIKKFSVEVRLFEIKYLKTKTKTQNLEIYGVQFKNRASLSFLFFFFFLLQGCSEMKMKIKE